MNMKKTLTAASIATIVGFSGLVQAAVLDVSSLTITGGAFEMGAAPAPGNAISAGAISPMNAGAYQGAPTDTAAGSLATFGFGVFGPVGTHTASNLLGAQVSVNGGALENPAALSGTVDDVAGTISMDMGSWFAFWNGNSFNQGDHNVGGTYNAVTGAFDMSWNSLITGGPFDGQTGFWNLTGTAAVDGGGPPAVPIPAAVWLFGSGLLGLVGVARRKKAA